MRTWHDNADDGQQRADVPPYGEGGDWLYENSGPYNLQPEGHHPGDGCGCPDDWFAQCGDNDCYLWARDDPDSPMLPGGDGPGRP